MLLLLLLLFVCSYVIGCAAVTTKMPTKYKHTLHQHHSTADRQQSTYKLQLPIRIEIKNVCCLRQYAHVINCPLLEHNLP